MTTNKNTRTREQRQIDQVEYFASLKQDQMSGDIEMISANKNDKFKIAAHDADKFVVVYTEIKNPAGDGKSINVEKNVIKIHANQFDLKVKEGFFYTYDYIEIVHDPRKQTAASKEYNTIGDFKPGIALPQAADLSRQDRPAPAGANNAQAKKLKEERAQFEADKKKHDDEIAQFAADKAAHDEAVRKHNEAIAKGGNAANVEAEKTKGPDAEKKN